MARSKAAAAPGLDVASLRAQYPALAQKVEGKALVYLDNACTALKPRRVAERMADFYLNWGACGGKRSTHLAAQRAEALLAEARSEVSRFIGADSPNEVVFTSGTTEAANLLARAFPFEGVRREVILSELEHNAVLLPFLEAERRGEARVRFCPAPGGNLDLNALESLVGERTALIAASRSSNVLGGRLPAAAVAKIAHRRGALLFVDDAQFLSSHREDVAAENIDFAAFSGHKLGGPFGIGVLYGKENLLNRLGNYKVGGGTVKSVEIAGDGAEAAYLDAPMRLEPGVPNFGGAVGLLEAVRHLSSLDPEAVRAQVSGLVRRTVAALEDVPQVRVLGEPAALAEGSLVSFAPAAEGFSLPDFNLYLNHELKGRYIAVRAGDHCAHLLHRKLGVAGSVRVSFFAYNTPEEADAFVEALRAYLKEAGL